MTRSTSAGGKSQPFTDLNVDTIFNFYKPKPPPNWAALALDLGYFDQSHLIREFLEFSGVSPTDYVNRNEGVQLETCAPMGEKVSTVTR